MSNLYARLDSKELKKGPSMWKSSCSAKWISHTEAALSDDQLQVASCSMVSPSPSIAVASPTPALGSCCVRVPSAGKGTEKVGNGTACLKINASY